MVMSPKRHNLSPQKAYLFIYFYYRELFIRLQPIVALYILSKLLRRMRTFKTSQEFYTTFYIYYLCVHYSSFCNQKLSYAYFRECQGPVFALRRPHRGGIGDLSALQARSDHPDARCGLPARSRGRGNRKKSALLQEMIGVSKSGCALDPGRARHGHETSGP